MLDMVLQGPACHDRIQAASRGRTIFRRSPRALAFADLAVSYPAKVGEALVRLYAEYNHHFDALVEMNREWPEDYRYCLDDAGSAVNWIVQIDMVGLNEAALSSLESRPVEDVVERLRGNVFEIENSWAAYRTHAGALGPRGRSRYSRMTQAMLDGVRARFDRPVALLAGTESKYRSMLRDEFDRSIDAPPSDREVFRTTGFDRFFGPDQFRDHLERNRGRCDYLLYVRSSDSVESLRDPAPDGPVPHPLFDDPRLRRLIRANALTFNIDDPGWDCGDLRRINDTKMYMPPMGMARVVESESDLERASRELGGCRLRVKPAQGSYGCYGHLSGHFSDKRLRYAVRNGLQRWKRYLVQPEREPPGVTNELDGRDYTFMDRVFCGMIGGQAACFGGHRLFLSRECAEVRHRRLHIVSDTVFAEIDVAANLRC